MGAAVGTAIPVVSPTPLGAATGALIALGGLLMSSVIGPFSARKLQEEMDAIKDANDQVPPELRTGKEWDEIFAPMVVRHLGFALRERSKVKLEAARIHLRKCLLEGVPTPEQDSLHQHVEKFLNDCTVNELVCLVGLKLALLSKADGVNKEDSYPQVPLGLYLGEEHLAKFVSVPPLETHLAMRGLEGRRYLVTYRHTSRNTPIPIQSPTGEDVHNPYWSFTTFGYRIADWLDEGLPPVNCADE